MQGSIKRHTKQDTHPSVRPSIHSPPSMIHPVLTTPVSRPMPQSAPLHATTRPTLPLASLPPRELEQLAAEAKYAAVPSRLLVHPGPPAVSFLFRARARAPATRPRAVPVRPLRRSPLFYTYVFARAAPCAWTRTRATRRAEAELAGAAFLTVRPGRALARARQ